MKKAKLIHLSHECVEKLSILAILKKTTFKELVQNILENKSKKIKDVI